ncbi:MAG: D-alanine--D-alanine ligase [Deltaproteobacteria bacterium]|nr:D-alanine--D-alanine ligase [Deltaproteobacteria bacterium]
MRVGLTYDLKPEYLAMGFSEEEAAEFDSPETIAAIEEVVVRRGHKPVRIGHAQALVARLAAGERWDLVFNIAEGLYGFGREALVPALLEAYRIPYTFSDPLVLSLSLHKGMTKRVLRDLGVYTADFAVVEQEADVAAIQLPFPLFAKPVAEGTGKGISAASKVHDRQELLQVCRLLLASHRQPVLVETYLPGRELTVGILGTGARARAIGVLEVTLHRPAEAAGYSYLNKKLWEDRVSYALVDDELAEEARRLSLAAWRGLGCRDAGRIDLRADAVGRLAVIELNPLAGIHPTISDLVILAERAGMPYAELISAILEEALQRAAAAATAGPSPSPPLPSPSPPSLPAVVAQ